MRFPDSLLSEIKARIPVSEVVGRRIKLRKQGREWAGLSPFNAEKTPSFFVNDQKAFYHDFSSGKHGDIFTFLMETEGLSFPEAVEQLAAQAGIPLPAPSAEVEQRERGRKSLIEAAEAACRFFEAKLQQAVGAAARAYLARRAIRPPTQAEFRVGFAPDSRDTLKRHLLAEGFEAEALIGAGLLVTPEEGPSRDPYDRFRNRLMFPIQDAKGRVVAFGGRVLAAEAKPKYLNSPQTELFHKGAMLFNAHRAKAAAHTSGKLLVVEGYLDAISVWQAGQPAVVATMGTAFTEDQIASLWRIAAEPTVCFDGDRAGLAAAGRAIDRILPALKTGNSFHFAYLPAGKDPDDLIRAGGLDALEASLTTAKPLFDALWARETETALIATPDQRAVLEKRLLDVTQPIGDSRVQKYYREQIRQNLKSMFWQQNFSRQGHRRPTDSQPPASGRLAAEPFTQEKLFLGLCVAYPAIVAGLLDRFAHVRLRGTDASGGFDDFLQEIIRIHHEEADLGLDRIYQLVSPAFAGLLDEVHGRPTETLPGGHRLAARFPVLRADPPFDFIARSLIHFSEIFMLRDLEDEIRDLTARYPHANEEAFEQRLNSRRAEFLALRERVRADANALAEEAANLKGFQARPAS
jgi:DNA primase